MVAMTHQILTNSQSRPRRPRRSAVWQLGAAVARWLQREREAEELARLDWRELKDVGLTPADVHMILSKPFWRA
jgi:uncharacterized protein YjiS (DUF1127 family)